MEILYFFEKIRTPFLDGLFLGITQMGDEIFFLALALIMFWCINKNMGYFLMSTCFFGVVLNQTLKLAFKVPRPWVRDASFAPVAAAIDAATGYSFPSGHTQNAVSIFGCLASGSRLLFSDKKKKVIFCVICIILAFGVALSRLYLGVHTFSDVIFSVALALGFVFLFRPVFIKKRPNPIVISVIIAFMVIATAAYLIYSYTLSSADEVEITNILTGQKHAWYMLGGVMGILVFYPLERRFVDFDPKTSFGIQVLKVIPGFILAFAIKELLKYPLDTVFHGHGISHSIRYFALVAFAVYLWPMCFKKFEKLRRK